MPKLRKEFKKWLKYLLHQCVYVVKREWKSKEQTTKQYALSADGVNNMEFIIIGIVGFLVSSYIARWIVKRSQ